jgi:AcrR family transcriptional regulator
MQKPDEAKRRTIMETAAELFCERAFHEVRLDEVAERARVGKGTLYVYFRSKDDLYATLITEGFTELLDRIRAAAESERDSAWESLALIVRQYVAWAKRYPHIFELLRPGHEHPSAPGLRQRRREVAKLIEATLRRGIRQGEIEDPRPDITAQFIPSCVRGALRFGPADIGEQALSNQILRVIGRGIQKGQS